MKKNCLMLITLLSTFMLLSACSEPSKKVSTIISNPESDYAKTFKELGLGIVFDFKIKVHEADQRWVTLWVERYEDGVLDTASENGFSYGKSLESLDDGHIGMGLLNSIDGSPQVFLYSPSGSNSPSVIKLDSTSEKPTTWDYAIGEEAVELELGKTQALAVYRQSKSNSIRPYDLQTEAGLEQMLQASSTALILKIKLEEESPSS